MKKPKVKVVHPTAKQDAEFLAAWKECKQNVAAVADKLGLSRQAIYNRIENVAPDCYYIVQVDNNFYQAVAVSHLLKRIWIATGKMSFTTAKRYAAEKRNVQNIVYTERSGKVVTVPKYAPKVVFVNQEEI